MVMNHPTIFLWVSAISGFLFFSQTAKTKAAAGEWNYPLSKAAQLIIFLTFFK